MANVRTLEPFFNARGLTRAELAVRVGVHRQAVPLWFRQENASVKSRHLVRSSDVLGVYPER